MRASTWEFENRFWVIGGIFFLGFSLPPFFDKMSSAEALVRILRPSLNPDSLDFRIQIQGLFVPGALLVFLAAAIRTWATAYLNASIVHDAPLHSEQLVAAGPYRYTRNPLYFGTVLLTIGLSPMATRAGAPLLIVMMTLFQYRLILREEAGLLESQGESYRRFVEAVPRLLPAWRARVPSSDVQPQWGQAVAAEMFFWLFGCSEVIFALTLNIGWFFGAMAVSLGSYFVFIAIWNRGRKTS